jgi:hypothetical protein
VLLWLVMFLLLATEHVLKELELGSRNGKKEEQCPKASNRFG